MAKPKKKIRADFRKNRSERARSDNWTQRFSVPDQQAEDEVKRDERISGKGDLARRRTVIGEVADSGTSGLGVRLEVDEAVCRLGRVLNVHGLSSTVAADDGTLYRCTTRRLLKTLSTDQRHVVAAGDRVWFRPGGAAEGVIERVEPRQGVLARDSRGRRHILVTNVDQVLIVASAAEPTLKPNLIDRFLVTAHQAGLRPLITINKVDLIDLANLMPFVGVYSQLGYSVLLVSAQTGLGIDRLRRELAGKASVVAGQSGVGKSSLLNAVDPALRLGRALGQRQQPKRQTHDDHCSAFAACQRRLRGRYARHPAIPAVGHHSGGSGGAFSRSASVCSSLPLSELHTHPRVGLCREACRGRRPTRRSPVRKLLQPVFGGRRMSAAARRMDSP